MRSLTPLSSVLAALLIAACSGTGTPGDTGGGGSGGGGGDAPDPPGNTHALTMNDVSVLFPLEGSKTASVLWPATLEGRGGPILPVATFATIGLSLTNGVGAADAEYAALRVVAARFDPCFPGAGVPCQAQVRLVLQAIDEMTGNAYDGAVHLLYNLSAAEFGALSTELRALTGHAPENVATAPLGPSPALTAQGGAGSYGTALRKLVTRHLGAANLARMTFMTRTDAKSGQWEFGGVNVKFYSPAGPLSIPGLPAGTMLQTVLSTMLGSRPEYTLTPPAMSHPEISPFLTTEGADAASPAIRAAAHETLLKLENPTLTSSETVDCVSCHVTRRLRSALEEVYPPASAPATRYEGEPEAHRVTVEADAINDNLRAFGHFHKAPAISQRTANETHAVLGAMATMYPEGS